MSNDSSRFIIHLLHAYCRVAFEINPGSFRQINRESLQAIRQLVLKFVSDGTFQHFFTAARIKQ